MDVLDDSSAPAPKKSASAPFLFGFLAASALAAGAYYLALPRAVPTPPPQVHRASGSSAPDAAALGALVADEKSKWPIPAQNFASTPEKARSAADALRRGDFAAAQALADEVLAHSTLQDFSFRPFNRFIDHFAPGNDPQLLAGLDAWVKTRPQSALAWLIRAQYYYDCAWETRGDDFSSAVPREHMQRFQDMLGQAEADLRHSIETDPGIPWSYFLQLKISVLRDSPQRIEQVFQAGIDRFPSYYELYRARLFFLTPKWGGSSQAMYLFVERYAGKAPASSPLKLLYMELTAQLLNASWVSCRSLNHEALTECINAYMNHYVTGGLAEGVKKALSLYRSSDPIPFSTALWPILGDMINTRGDSASIDTVLQMAGEAMGSDNQLIHEPGHNNYVLDDITARVWSKLDDMTNVDQKFHEALDDVLRMPFKSEDDRRAALAGIYDDMAWVARNHSLWVKVIAYQDAANEVAGVGRGGTQYNKCFAYYQLRHLQEAVDECTLLIDTHRGSLRARTYRAWANEALKHYDEAVADYLPIAEDGSDKVLRTGAVINMEHIDVLRGRIDEGLEVFDKYPFIFDTAVQNDDDLAIAFNNRCFLFKQKGELRKALDDCTTSLKYGRLPDALQKHQELVKLLGQKIT